jgi:hypothetical protein
LLRLVRKTQPRTDDAFAFYRLPVAAVVELERAGFHALAFGDVGETASVGPACGRGGGGVDGYGKTNGSGRDPEGATYDAIMVHTYDSYENRNRRHPTGSFWLRPMGDAGVSGASGSHSTKDSRRSAFLSAGRTDRSEVLFREFA